MALTAAFLVLFLCHSALGQLKWVELKPSSGPSPSARRDSSIGYDAKRNQIVIFGGRVSGNSGLGDTWVFDLSSKKWTKVADTTDGSGKVIPEKRFSVVFGNQGDFFYVSTGEDGSTYFNDVNRFNFTSQKWEKLAAKSAVEPEKRYGSGGGVWPATGDGLYITHGFSGVRYSNTFKFRFDTQVWEKKFNGAGSDPNLPLKRCLHATTMFDKNQFVLYGGCISQVSVSQLNKCPTDDGWKYNGDTNKWTKLSNCATARTYTAMAMLPSNDHNIKRAVLYGGQEGSPASPANEIVVFDPATNKWMKKKIEGAVPPKRFSNVMVTTKEGIVVFGGQSASPDVALNDVWLLKGNASDVSKTATLPGCDAEVMTSTSAPKDNSSITTTAHSSSISQSSFNSLNYSLIVLLVLIRSYFL